MAAHLLQEGVVGHIRPFIGMAEGSPQGMRGLFSGHAVGRRRDGAAGQYRRRGARPPVRTVYILDGGCVRFVLHSYLRRKF